MATAFFGTESCGAGATSVWAGQIVTQPIPGRQQSTGDKTTAARKSAPVKTTSASLSSSNSGLQWKSPQTAAHQAVGDDGEAKPDVATASVAVAKMPAAKSDAVTSASPDAQAVDEAAASRSVAVKSMAQNRGWQQADGSSGIGDRLKELETKAAAGQVRRIAGHDSNHQQVVQTAATEPKIDPFGDDDTPAAKTPAAKSSAKRDGTPFKRAAQAGVQPGRANGPNDPFPGDQPLGQKPAEPPGRLGPFDEPLTQAPRRGPEPCPSPRDLKPLNQISNKIDAEPGEFPAECGLGNESFDPRQWSMTTYTWKATGLCHKPLYFEDVQLERYGNTCSPLLQPIISGAHFFATSAILPYKMGLEAPCECIYPLGTYRPGSCAPFYFGPLPISARGALYQTGAVLGLVFLIP